MATQKRYSANAVRHHGHRGAAAPRRKARRLPLAGLILYPLSVLAGLYLGVQAYAKYLDPAKPHPTKNPKAGTSDPKPQPTASADVGETPRVSVSPSPAPVKAAGPETPPAGKVPAVEIERATTGRPEVALTLDAGADWRPAGQILDTLKKEGLRTTFFLTGEWVKANPRTTRRIAGEGHEIGNHSWDHPAFTSLSDEQIRDQLERTEAAIREATGKTSRPYFRPPLGDRDARVRQAVADAGFLSVYWTLDSHDSVQKGITASQIKERVLGEIAPGSIVLLHCGSQATADALPEILSGLRQRSLRPVPLGELLAR